MTCGLVGKPDRKMKEYKVDLSMYTGRVREAISVAIQRHAFELGYEWNSVSKDVFWTKSPYLFFNEDGRITHLSDEDVSHFEGLSGTDISADDFLDLSLEPEFKPFQKVLVRDYNDEAWTANIYSHRDDNSTYIHRTVGDVSWRYCIPYEGNECLLGTDEPIVS